MDIKFHDALENANNYSKIRYAATPKISLNELVLKKNNTDKLTFTHSGGTALFSAGDKLRREENVILVPSYHCPAALEPFIALGFECLLYRVNKDLAPNIDHIDQLIAQHKVSHLLTINYFGVISHISDIAQHLSNTNIKIIHDCAHSLFELLSYAKQPTYADATICSINKILPSIDGGIVTFKQHATPVLQKVSLIRELKALSYLLGATRVINGLRSLITKPKHSSLTAQQPSSALRYLAVGNLENQCFRHTICILQHSNLQQIASKRRKNYQYLCEQLTDATAGTILQQTLKEGDVPYVLPFLLHNDNDFSYLRRQGIQCLRWEEVAKSDCAVSQDYRFRLLQLPCHHQLNKRQLDDIVAKIQELP